ncbi:cytochrome c-like [Musa acuminata AAA Group]|uniref:cytochrome c-like n=1 Tax=Musa acuminata AAA Group TaxID=214697 RepID=UPI0031D5A498
MASFEEAPPGDANSGHKIFQSKCAHCHTVEKGAGHKHGPNLHGLFGKQYGTTPGYSYSTASKNIDVIWEENSLYDYLLNPKEYIPLKKKFPGMKNPQERADLIAYLKEATTS